MPVNTTLTVRLPLEVKRRLARLARSTKRTRSFLARAAIADFVERESAISEAVLVGLADAKEGRLVPHEKVAAEIATVVAHAKRHKRRH